MSLKKVENRKKTTFLLFAVHCGILKLYTLFALIVFSPLSARLFQNTLVFFCESIECGTTLLYDIFAH